jgi:ABC-2 type transport system ATP-binding protein
MNTTADAVIRTTALTKAYGQVRVLNGVDIAVPAGSVFALLGPNGAGKTTTVRILATLLHADGGQARVAGFDVRREPGQVRRRISLTGQYAAVDDMQTGTENLRMMGRLAGLSRRDASRRATDLLDRLGLAEAKGRRVGTYSGGMRRRLDLASSLVRPPVVLFLDEPTTGLDPRSRQELWQLIGELAGAGVTVFLTTQYLEEADRLAHRVAVMHGGTIVADGTPAQLKAGAAAQRLDLTLTDHAGYTQARRLLGDRILHADPVGLTLGVGTDGSAGQVRRLLDEIDPRQTMVGAFSVHTATLDDVFLALTGETAGPPAEETADV